jgi:hypothetical protein
MQDGVRHAGAAHQALNDGLALPLRHANLLLAAKSEIRIELIELQNCHDECEVL